MRFSIIVAATPSLGIGFEGGLPWKRLSGDMKYFKELTSTTKSESLRNAVVMGRKTWESIPAKFRPLPSRLNVILTRDPASHPELVESEDVLVCNSLDQALARINGDHKDNVEQTFIIGGGQIYKQAAGMTELEKIYLTRVKTEFECDTHFVFNSDLFKEIHCSEIKSSNGIDYEFVTLERTAGDKADVPSSAPAIPHVPIAERENPEHEEWQYLDMIRDIIQRGVARGDRTGTGTLAIFGTTMRFNLRDDIFPLLTTKRVFWRGLAEELLWFVKGCTNANELAEKKIHIWDGNGSREFLDSRGFTDREVGDLGPVYGFQWRHFGAQYKDMHTDYTGQGVDQLKTVIELIKNNPTSRRILLSAWNPADLGKMALPPCHMFCQFFVANGELSCQMYQRSADMGLGVPFNIASYSLLTRMIAQVCGLKAGEFVHVIGDCHVYSNHVEPLKEQLVRQPYPFPTLKINPDVTDIDGFKYSDFTIEGYKCHKKIAMKMAV